MPSRPSLACALALALGSLAPLSGCTSPETASDPMATGFAAAGLTYATGDTKEGTVTVASLPLLSYYHYHEDPKTHDRAFRLCWIPLLGSIESETHDILGVVTTLAAPPSCPDDDAPPPPPPPKKGKIIIRTEEDDDDLAPTPPAPSRAAPLAAPAAAGRPTPSPGSSSSAPAASSSAPAASSSAPSPTAGSRATTPGAKRGPAAPGNGAKILRSEPGTRTDVDFFFPLFHVERERPGTAVIQRPGRGKSVVEVGDSEDHVRALPIFSYRRDAERERLILWPLLASGFDDDAEGSHLVLFYFLRIRTGDPEKHP